MKKAIVYIDGYNLYFGLLKGTPWKWLDLWGFAKSLLDDCFDLLEVRYFTAPIKTHPADAAATERQNAYIQAIATFPGVKITTGFYSKNKMRAPYVAAKCADCDVVEDGLVQVYKMEEKRSDVNLAVSSVIDAADGRADCFVYVTGDSDQVGAIEAIRYKYGKTVVVFNPHESGGKHLKRAASFYKNIPRDLPARCQLPDAIPVGTHGNFIRRPAPGGTRSVASDKRSTPPPSAVTAPPPSSRHRTASIGQSVGPAFHRGPHQAQSAQVVKFHSSPSHFAFDSHPTQTIPQSQTQTILSPPCAPRGGFAILQTTHAPDRMSRKGECPSRARIFNLWPISSASIWIETYEEVNDK